MKEISPILKSLGLLESEIKVYMKTLEKGPSTVIELAKATGLSRQACYVAIEALTERSLMTSVLKGKRNYYAAEHPSKLVSYAQRRELEINDQIKELERAIPSLEMQLGGEKPVVKLYEGKEGIKATFDDYQSTRPEEIHQITDLDALYSLIKPEELAERRLFLKKIGAKIYGLHWSKTPPAQESERYNLPEKYKDFKSHISVYGDKIFLVTFEGKLYSVLIESKALAKAMKILFELAHEQIKKT